MSGEPELRNELETAVLDGADMITVQNICDQYADGLGPERVASVLCDVIDDMGGQGGTFMDELRSLL